VNDGLLLVEFKITCEQRSVSGTIEPNKYPYKRALGRSPEEKVTVEPIIDNPRGII